MMKFAKVAAALAIGTMALLGASSAQAATSPYADVTPNLNASTTVEQIPDPVCEQARNDTKSKGKCGAEQTMVRSAARVATAAEIAQAPAGTFATAATVYITGWSQTQRGLYYVNWTEKHEGKFLWNGSIAWVSDRYGYTGGYHRCGLGYGIGYSVSVTYCEAYGQSTYTVDNYDAYQVHVVAKGIPIYATHSMHAYTRGNGSIA